MNCKIIQDLLPLYADGIASEETNEAVREHIAECEECGGIYKKMTESSQIIENTQNKRDVDYMKKIKSRGIKITAAAVGILSFITAAALICFKLFYWGFELTPDDIIIDCDISERSNKAGDFVDVDFNITLKNGMKIRYDDSVYLNYTDGCEYRYNYITPKAVFKNPFDIQKDFDHSTTLFGYGVPKNNNYSKFEFNIILKDTSYNYDINEIVEEYLHNA